MNDYIIAIGGSGARVLKPIIFLCAVGLVESTTLHVMLVDPDKSNGNTTDVCKLIEIYQKAYEKFHVDGKELFKTKIEAYPVTFENKDARCRIVTPLSEGKGTINTIKDLTGGNRDAELLLQALFTSEEEEQTLEQGFRAHPAIGATVFCDYCKEEPVFQKFFEKIADDPKVSIEKPAKMLVIGSLFGGTGAAGLPSVPRYARHFISKSKNLVRDKLMLGGLVMMPYFGTRKDDTGNNEKGIQIEENLFILNAVNALKYYKDQHFLNNNAEGQKYNAFYVIGTDSFYKTVGRYSVGTGTQNNEASVMELFAAMAATRFFGSPCISNEPDEVFTGIAEVGNEGDISWKTLEKLSTVGSVREGLLKLLRTAYVFFTLIYYSIFNYNATVSLVKYGVFKGAPGWYRNFVAKNSLSKNADALSEELSPIKNFFSAFISWFYEISRCGDYAIELTDKNLLSNIYKVVKNSREINNKKLDDFYSSISEIDPTVASGAKVGADKITEELAKLDAPSGNYSRELINSLYEICS